jgi:hypothetical protein
MGCVWSWAKVHGGPGSPGDRRIVGSRPFDGQSAFGVGAADPLTLAGVAVLLALVSLLAA